MENTTMLNNNQLRLHTADQKQGRGGGLALIHKAQYPVKFIRSGTKPSFEHATWELKVDLETCWT